MNTPDATVYIIVLNWNGADDTCACLESLLELDYPKYQILVCDNASADDSVLQIRNWANGRTGEKEFNSFFKEINASDELINNDSETKTPAVTLIHTGSNLGYAGGMNVGIRYALSRGDMDFVWILNNDTVVKKQSLRELVFRSTFDRTIGICGSTLLYFHNRNEVQAYGGAVYKPWRARSAAIGAFSHIDSVPTDASEVEKSMSYVIGASMLVKRSFIDIVGLMDESYFLYSEEHDWAFRGEKAGFRLGYAPQSIVFHKHGATIGTSPKGGSSLSLFYLYRAKLMFSARHYKSLLPIVCVALIWDAVKFFLKGQPRKALALGKGMVAAFTGRDFS